MDARIQPPHEPVFYLLLSAAIVKISVLVINGPSVHPDSDAYVTYADAILDYGRAFALVDWGAEADPRFIFRLPGYPLILAGAKLVSPANYGCVVVIFQCVLNSVAVYLIFKVTERLFQSSGAALLVAAIYIFSESILLDNSILSDSIYCSLFNIVIFGLLGHLMGCWRLSLSGSAGLAALWGYSVLTRDAGLYFTVFPIILTIAIAVCGEDVFIRRRLGHFIIFALVTSAIVAMYVMLNRYRTGEIFFSIAGLKNWLHPISDMARHGYAQPFIGDDLVSVAAQETLRGDYGYEAQIRLVRRLHELCQCTPTQEQSLLFTKYLLVICNNPTAYLRVILTNFSSLQSIVADPVWTINSFIQLGTPIGRVVPGLSLKNIAMLVQDFSLTKFALLVLAAISTTVSAIAFWLFIFGIPMRVICEWRTGKRMNDTLAVTSFLWLLFVSLATSYSLVHVEPRYVLPALPAALVGVVYTLQWLRGALFRFGSVADVAARRGTVVRTHDGRRSLIGK
jgi:hypothetical protein